MNLKITKTSLCLMGIFILGLILRLLAASHAAIGPDEMVYSVIPINIISASRLSTVEQSPIYFYLVDIGYKLFGGVTPITSRLPSILFGSLTILLLFFIVRDMFESKTAGLSSAFLFAVSGYVLRYNYETDMAAFFFALLSIYFFIHALKGESRFLYLSSFFFAISVLIKNITLLFVPAYAIIWLWYNYSNQSYFISDRVGGRFNWKIIRVAAAGVAISVLAISPILIYNYLLYQEKGVTDYYFSNVLGIGETVHKGLEGKPWSFDTLFVVASAKLRQFFFFDAPIFVFGILGVFFGFRRNKYWATLIFTAWLVFTLYLSGQTSSNSHYIWAIITFSIFAGCFIDHIYSFLIKHKPTLRHAVIALLVFAFLFNIIMLRDILFYKSSILALREYVHDEIPNNALVIIDPQVYRGIHAWVFNDKHYIDGSYFSQLQKSIHDTQGSKISVPVYYVACGNQTTCLWSTQDTVNIHDYSLQLTYAMTKFMIHTATVAGTDREPGNAHVFEVYLGSLDVPSGIVNAVDETHFYYFYPVGWKYPSRAVDNYSSSGFGKILSGFGFLLLYADLLGAVLSIPLIFYIFAKGGAVWNHMKL